MMRNEVANLHHDDAGGMCILWKYIFRYIKLKRQYSINLASGRVFRIAAMVIAFLHNNWTLFNKIDSVVKVK